MPHALGPKLSSSLQGSPPAAFDPVAVVAGDSSRRTRDVVRGSASSNPGSLAAISVGWHARPRHTPHPCGFVRGDSRCVVSAGTPAGYIRVVPVDRWMAGKSAGSSDNYGSASCSLLVLLERSLTKRSSKTNPADRRNIENGYRVLTASLRVG